MIKFKSLFPTWEHFKQFVKDYQFYYKDSDTVFTDQNLLVYYTILYRNFSNSTLSFDNEVFLEMFSMTVSENFREFFIIRGLIDLVAAKGLDELLIGVETINNLASNPNIDTNKDTILDYIGSQNRSKSQENVVDRVYSLIPKVNIPEIRREVQKYDYLFLKIIPRTVWIYPGEEV